MWVLLDESKYSCLDKFRRAQTLFLKRNSVTVWAMRFYYSLFNSDYVSIIGFNFDLGDLVIKDWSPWRSNYVLILKHKLRRKIVHGNECLAPLFTPSLEIPVLGGWGQHTGLKVNCALLSASCFLGFRISGTSSNLNQTLHFNKIPCDLCV